MTEMSTRENTVEFSDSFIRTIEADGGWDSENTPVFAVVNAVADAAGGDPLELPPLHDVINAEALNDLFTGRPEATVAKVSFQYAGYDITVHGTGEVEVQPVPTTA